jgi:RNA polymerase sigma-70 factor (ECF subfamily)
MVSMAVARGKEGDREAIRYLYVRYSHNIYGYVRSIVHDEHDAEDITQHVFAKLMSILRKYDERGVPFSAWIIRVARNAALDHVRQRRPIPVEEVREHDGHAGDQTVHQHRSLMLRDALATLPEDQREVLVLRHLVGLSPGEIAERLGRTEPSIHGLHHRGRRALQAELTSRDSMPSTALLSAAA